MDTPMDIPRLRRNCRDQRENCLRQMHEEHLDRIHLEFRIHLTMLENENLRKDQKHFLILMFIFFIFSVFCYCINKLN